MYLVIGIVGLGAYSIIDSSHTEQYKQEYKADLEAKEKELGLECKTASPYMADHWKNGQIPIHYELQCHHYMVVTGADCWYIAVLIYGREFKWYRIERDEELINYLIEVERDF